MKAGIGQRGQALILLATWLLLGGSAASALVVFDRSSSAMRSAIDSVIADGDRREALLADIKRWESAQKDHDKAVAKARDQLLDILGRQDAARPDVEPVMARIDQRFGVMDRDFLDLRFRIRERVSAAEWTRIVALSRQAAQ